MSEKIDLEAVLTEKETEPLLVCVFYSRAVAKATYVGRNLKRNEFLPKYWDGDILILYYGEKQMNKPIAFAYRRPDDDYEIALMLDSEDTKALGLPYFTEYEDESDGFRLTRAETPAGESLPNITVLGRYLTVDTATELREKLLAIRQFILQKK